MLQTIENIVTILILAGALVFFIWEHRANTNKIDEMSKQISELQAAVNNVAKDNGCDTCCQDCADRAVCKGKCVHADDGGTF